MGSSTSKEHSNKRLYKQRTSHRRSCNRRTSHRMLYKQRTSDRGPAIGEHPTGGSTSKAHPIGGPITKEYRKGGSTRREHPIRGSTRGGLKEHGAYPPVSSLLFSIALQVLLCSSLVSFISSLVLSITISFLFSPPTPKYPDTFANNPPTAQWANPAPQPS